MTVLGVLLAAGTGSRFEAGNKLLADLGGDPVVVRSAETLVEAHAGGFLDDLVAVVGHEAERTAEALADLPFETVENPDYEAGQATSVARGVRVARERGADAAVFALGDLPCVDASTVEAVVAAWRDSDDGAGIVVPTCDGRRGNPVLFDARHFDELLAVSSDTGGRELFDASPVERVPVDDPGIHRDVDTVGDLAELRE
ncbi:nucleotidyltransferase family protein [Halobacteriales archaeon QS_1_68_20]|nr:MAG: nucleotidyltransferase family protein [Halobacteriales archaeon QS_1_68_20]